MDQQLKVSLFADDLTGFAVDLTSLVCMIKHIESFGDISGLRINRKKSKKLPTSRDQSYPPSIEGIELCQAFQTLGVWFTNEESLAFNYEQNFRPVLNKMKTCCNSLSSRSLSLKGKITTPSSPSVSNTYAQLSTHQKGIRGGSNYDYMFHLGVGS